MSMTRVLRPERETPSAISWNRLVPATQEVKYRPRASTFRRSLFFCFCCAFGTAAIFACACADWGKWICPAAQRITRRNAKAPATPEMRSFLLNEISEYLEAIQPAGTEYRLRPQAITIHSSGSLLLFCRD